MFKLLSGGEIRRILAVAMIIEIKHAALERKAHQSRRRSLLASTINTSIRASSPADPLPAVDHTFHAPARAFSKQVALRVSLEQKAKQQLDKLENLTISFRGRGLLGSGRFSPPTRSAPAHRIVRFEDRTLALNVPSVFTRGRFLRERLDSQTMDTF